MESKYRPGKVRHCYVTGVIRTWVSWALVTILCYVPMVDITAQNRPLGVNLTDVSPFGTLWYYSNALKQSTGWLVYNADDEGDPINLSSELTRDIHSTHFDGHGYPLVVPFESEVEPDLSGKSLIVSCLVLSGQPEPYLYPSGTYLLSFEGTGVIAIQGDVDGEYMEFAVADSYHVPISRPTTTGLQLFILESDQNDPVRNVSLIFPGYHGQPDLPKYQEDFLVLARQFEVLRFMKPLKSENNTIVNFEDRSTFRDFSYFLDVENDVLPGMPYEDVIEISNLSGADPWITIPYLASDEYVRATAALFNSLDNERRIYVEYSNETWNPAYPETRAHMLERGMELATSEIPEVAEFEAIHRYHTLRSLEIWQIFEETLEETARLVKVHGSQSDPFTADLVWDAYESDRVNPRREQPDVIAIAAYIGVILFDDLRDQDINICDHAPEEMLDTLVNRIRPELAEMVSRYQELYQGTGIEIVAYEGGQHVTELNFRPMEPCAERLVAAMNRLPGMNSFFCELLDTWYERHDGGLFNVFNLAERPDAFGAFGLLESQWQMPGTSPKWQGALNCETEVLLAANSQFSLQVYPNPAFESIHFRTKEHGHFELISLAGDIISQGDLQEGEQRVSLDSAVPGMYLLKFVSPSGTSLSKISVKPSK